MRHHRPLARRNVQPRLVQRAGARQPGGRTFSEVGIIRRGPEHRRRRHPRDTLDAVGERQRTECLHQRVQRPAEEPRLLSGRHDDTLPSAHTRQPRRRRTGRPHRLAQRVHPAAPHHRLSADFDLLQPLGARARSSGHHAGGQRPIANCCTEGTCGQRQPRHRRRHGHRACHVREARPTVTPTTPRCARRATPSCRPTSSLRTSIEFRACATPRRDHSSAKIV